MTDTARLRELDDPALSCCPFCGATAWLTHNEPTGEWVIWCDQCDAHMADPGKEDVVAAWNRRVVLDELDASKARIAEVEGAKRARAS